MPTLNSDPGVVARLQNQQLLQKFASDSAPDHQEVVVEKAKREIAETGKRVVDVAKKSDVVKEWLLLADTTIALAGGVLRLRSGQRIDSPAIARELKEAGVPLKPIVG